MYETLKRDGRDLDSKSYAHQLALLENVFMDGEYKKTEKRSRAIDSHMLSFDGHRIHRRDSLPKSRALKSRKTKARFTKLTHRNIVPAYFYEPISKLPEEVSDKESDMNLNSAFSIPHPVNTMVNPYQRELTIGKGNKLEIKALALLKRVGLGLVTISDLSLEMTATMKEVIVRVSGKATPKKIGGWFNFEILRKDIFAVGFTAEQAGFEDFIAKMFNTSLSLFEKLEQTTVCSFMYIYLAAALQRNMRQLPKLSLKYNKIEFSPLQLCAKKIDFPHLQHCVKWHGIAVYAVRSCNLVIRSLTGPNATIIFFFRIYPYKPKSTVQRWC